MVCILLGSMTRWFLFLARAGLRCMMAVATAAPAKRCLQVDAIPVFPVRALHGRIIGLLAVGFTGHACSPQTFLPVTNQKWRGGCSTWRRWTAGAFVLFLFRCQWEMLILSREPKVITFVSFQFLFLSRKFC